MEVGHLPPSRRSDRADGRSCTTLKIISVVLWFHTPYVNMCIFKHYPCLREGWRRCTMPLWVVTRSWSLCCLRPRQQWILKTIKVRTHTDLSVLTSHCVNMKQVQSTHRWPDNNHGEKKQEIKNISGLPRVTDDTVSCVIKCELVWKAI